MFKRSSNALKTWVVVGVGALVLALSAFFILSTYPPDLTLAQSPGIEPDPVKIDLVYVPDPITIGYNENGEGPVTTFTSADPDPEGARIEWNVIGLDADDFQISNTGVLTFMKSPNFEKATDRAHDANDDNDFDDMGTSSNSPDTDFLDSGIDDDGDGIFSTQPDYPRDEVGGDNEYVIMVVATEVRAGLSGHRAEATATKVRVEVLNVDEDGSISLQWRQPQVAVPIMATLKDDDMGIGGDTPSTTSVTWTWYTSVVDDPVATFDAHWAEIPRGRTGRIFSPSTDTPNATDTYTPNADIVGTPENDSDVGGFLRVKAVYMDGQGQVTKTAYGKSEFPVRAVPSSNGSPDFGEGATTERMIAENMEGDIGAAVGATDRNIGDHLTYTLEEVMVDNNPDLKFAGDHMRLSVNRATGQLATKEPKGLNYERTDTGREDGKYGVVVKATDPSGDTDTIMVTIKVSDRDDPPKITSGAAEHVVEEENSDDLLNNAYQSMTPDGNIDEAYTDFTGNSYMASDDDGDLISWEFEGADAADFKPCGGDSTCALRFKEVPDYEAPADANGDNIYELMLVAKSTTHSAKKAVTVIVENVNEVGNLTFSATQPHIDRALTAMVMDPDGARLSDGSQVALTTTLDGYPQGRVPDGGITILTWQWYKSKMEVDEDLDSPTGTLIALTNPIAGEEGHWDVIPDATSAIYMPTSDDKGHHLRAVATYIDLMSPPDAPSTAGDERIGERRLRGVLVPNPRMVRARTANAVRAAPEALVTPVFENTPYTRMLAENARIGDYVGSPVVAMDPDSPPGELAYRLTGSTRYFSIDNYGQIKVKGIGTDEEDRPPFDYEGRPNTFTVHVEARDDEGHISQLATVNIELTNLNEKPVFDNTSRGANFELAKTIDYDENDTADVFDFNATDPERASIRWSLMGADASGFTINTDGVLRFRKSPNHEAKQEYMVRVIATEIRSSGQMGRTMASEVALTVTITDKDEGGKIKLSLLQPEGANPDGDPNADGDQAEPGTELTATLTDPDTAYPDTDAVLLTGAGRGWTWYRAKHGNPSSAPRDATQLDQDWTEVRTENTTGSYSPDANDEGKYLLVRARYTDGDGVTDTRTTYARSHTVVRKSMDLDNSSPEFPTGTATMTRMVDENIAVGANVGAAVEVGNLPARDVLTYDMFPFTQTTITTNGDFPTSDPEGLKVFPANARPGVSDTEDDTGNFEINRVTGQITVKSKLTFERNTPSDGKYVVLVRAKNSSNVGQVDNEGARNDTAYVKLTITARDVNEAPGIVGMAEIMVREKDSSKMATHADYYYGLGKTPDGSADPTTTEGNTDNVYMATDPEGNSPGLTVSGDDAADFRPKTPDGGSGLALFFRDPPDYDAPMDADMDNVYHVTIVANDGDGNTSSKNVTIEVMPTTVEMDPEAEDGLAAEETGKLTLMPEEPLLGSMVMASLNDPDGIMTDPEGMETITSWQWYWTSSDIDMMDPDDDSATDNPLIDDNGDLVATVTVSGATYAPDSDGDLASSGGVKYAGMIAGATTDTYMTTKRDVGRFLHVRVTYRDGSNPEDDELTSGVDESTPVADADIADGDESLIGKDRVVIKGTDNAVAPEPATTNAPEFAQGIMRYVAEMTPRGGYVGEPVMAMDADVARDVDELTYTINGSDARYFELFTDPTDDTRKTGQIMVKEGTAAYQFNFEDLPTSYTVTVTATDRSDLTATATVTIMVGNVNEVPTMPEESFGLQINGSATVQHPELLSTMDLGTYRAGGAGGAAVTWTLSGPDMGQFTLSNAGALSFNAMPDYENPTDAGTDNSYEVTIMVSAGSETDRLNVTVNVVNEDEDGVATLWADATTALTMPPQVGDTITGAVMDPDGNPGDTPPIAMDTTITNVDWKWSMSDMMEGTYTPIVGATDAAYMVTTADAEMYLKAEATYTDGEGSGKMEEVMTMMVGAEAVEPMETALSMYDDPANGGNGNGIIDRDEYQAAAEHYLRDTIEKETYQEIAELYLRS